MFAETLTDEAETLTDEAETLTNDAEARSAYVGTQRRRRAAWRLGALLIGDFADRE